MAFELVKLLHILGACVLIGTGAGIAFFMLMAHRSGSPSHVAHVARTVVIADFLFTASAVIVQPLTGVTLAHLAGWSLTEGWILISFGLYILIGACWLPVVWIQMELRKEAENAVAKERPLGARYHRLFRLWFVLGIPAFTAILALLWLMISRPGL